METGFIFPADLEVRQAGSARQLRGEFPYDSLATTASRGRVRKERLASRAFEYVVDGAGRDREVSLLAGHELGKPLASRKAKSLELRESDKALTFRADLTPERSSPSWVNDTWAAVSSGLMVGLSPGFTVPPSSTVPDAEELVPEPGNPNVMIRVIRHAVLWELSVVTRAAYPTATVGKRAAPLPPSPAVSELLGWL